VLSVAAKLQLEVQRLREGVEQRRLHRLESSESIIQDARARLEVLQNSVSVPFRIWSGVSRAEGLFD